MLINANTHVNVVDVFKIIVHNMHDAAQTTTNTMIQIHLRLLRLLLLLHFPNNLYNHATQVQ